MDRILGPINHLQNHHYSGKLGYLDFRYWPTAPLPDEKFKLGSQGIMRQRHRTCESRAN